MIICLNQMKKCLILLLSNCGMPMGRQTHAFSSNFNNRSRYRLKGLCKVNVSFRYTEFFLTLKTAIAITHTETKLLTVKTNKQGRF